MRESLAVWPHLDFGPLGACFHIGLVRDELTLFRERFDLLDILHSCTMPPRPRPRLPTSPSGCNVPIPNSIPAPGSPGTPAVGPRDISASGRALPLSVEGVDLRFGGIHALRGVSFSAAPGEITALPTCVAEHDVHKHAADYPEQDPDDQPFKVESPILDDHEEREGGRQHRRDCKGSEDEFQRARRQGHL